MTISRRDPITLVLTRFEDIVSVGLRALIDTDENLSLLAADVEPDQVEGVIRAHEPDVVILNYGSLRSAAELRELSAVRPETRLFVLSNNPSEAECRQMIGFGATACLAKFTEARDVLHAIYLASRGLQVLPGDQGAGGPSNVSTPEPAGPAPLTDREADVLELLQIGRTNSEIAGELHVGIETVRTHARHIYRKLGVGSRRELRSPA